MAWLELTNAFGSAFINLDQVIYIEGIELSPKQDGEKAIYGSRLTFAVARGTDLQKLHQMDVEETIDQIERAIRTDGGSSLRLD